MQILFIASKLVGYTVLSVIIVLIALAALAIVVAVYKMKNRRPGE